MAEKFVKIGKMFDPTLPTPSSVDEEPPKKKKKIQSGLWTCEGRMFHEKIIFLNKSTTKFVIVGIHPISFKPMMKICDRATGTYFSIGMEQFVFFFRHITSLIDEDFPFGSDEDSGIEVIPISMNVWKIRTPTELGIVVHKTSLEKLIEIQDCIFSELNQRLSCLEEYKNTIDEIRDATTEFSEREILKYLHEIRMNENVGSLKYQVALDLVFSRDYLLTLPEYYNNFYRRNVFIPLKTEN